MKLNQEQKSQIAALVENHVQSCNSQNEAVMALKNVSTATISQIRNGNWASISDKMWISLAKQLGWEEGSWNTVLITPAKELRAYLNDAANWNIVHGVVAEAGTGKTHIAREFAKENEHVFHLVCNEFWNKKQFLSEILTTMGEDSSGMNAYDMVNRIVQKILGMPNPLLILDEADKLNDGALYLFITLFNQLEGKCGIVMLSTDHLEKRIRKGIRLNKKGYKEINSRLGHKFITLEPIRQKDIEAVCHANGIENPIEVNRIVNDSFGDLRRVKKHIIMLLNKQAEMKVAS